ncbi:methyl-accepting chemotaxis protein [Modicisalibacter radicis]|uniref:methyl-accepting chemotaxis protein n=1 Tax=Halomonas sp. EAR18 TaxID=2518972 RepID=UPI00109C80DF|nr:PAS domain-containing methyl-accepting chemotaxis protein [Halomonas sp. EAR18]
MRNNQPVTQREYSLDDEHYLISRTDLKGRITYVNPAFAEVSGFAREELIGSPHNLVRHPDMPEAAFANLWETLEAGESWHGLVKNRRKDGDYYWVSASVTPIYEAGEVQGYASVRVKAAPEMCAYAERVYAQLRAGKARGVKLVRGQIVRRGLIGWLGRVRLRSLQGRMATMIVVSMLLLVASGALGFYGLQTEAARLDAVNDNGLKDVARLQRVEQLMNRSRSLLADPVGNPMAGGHEEAIVKVEEMAAEVRTVWDAYMARDINHGDEAATFAAGLENYVEAGLLTTARSLTDGEYYQAFIAYNDVLEPEAERLSGIVSGLVSAKQDTAQDLVERAHETEKQILTAQLILGVTGLLLLIVMGALSMRAIRRPLDESKRFTLQISAGNLAATMPSNRNDEVGELMASLNVMRLSLSSIVKDVNHSVGIVRPASRDIADGNEDLSSRTEQQAASLQETASSMEQMTATVKQNASNAREASGLSSNAASSVRESGEVMGDVVDTMGRITDSSRKVSEIIGVIDSIAFQTNILALNASVEAARAGEQGRGFAVVASEVRNLAGRSADAAREIRALIDGSAQEIDNGAALVKRAETSIEGVVGAVLKVNDIMGEIASASDEQTGGIDQINQAIAQMDEVTQQNAERVQSSARAAQSLDEQVSKLADAVAVLRLAGSGRESVDRATRFKAAEHRRELSHVTSETAATSAKPARTPAGSESEWEAF